MEELPCDALRGVLQRVHVEDLCALSACSHALARAAGDPLLWRHLYLRRWGASPSPGLRTPGCDPSCEVPQTEQWDIGLASSGSGNWRGLVQSRHKQARQHALGTRAELHEALGGSTSLEVFAYQRCMGSMHQPKAAVAQGAPLPSPQLLSVADGDRTPLLGFEDVRRSMLRKSDSVLLNLMGLHFCIQRLAVSPDALLASLRSSGIEERAVFWRCWTLGPWAPQGFRRKDVMTSCTVTLGQLVQPRVVDHLRRGLFCEAQAAWAAPYQPGATAAAWRNPRGQQQGQERQGAGAARMVGCSETERNAVRLFERLVQGTVHEVMRVQISEDFTSSAWVGREMPSQR